MFSIIIPTFNNIKYLKLCIESIKKNSIFNHEIIVHVNIGEDGTKEYLDNATPAQLHEFHFIHEDNMGSIPKEFNCLVGHYDLKGAKALHYTNGGPWFDDYRDAEASEEWWRVYNSL